jgi:DNA-binding response OmpR family regulator
MSACKDGNPYVLIADDDPDTLTMLKYFAEKRGWCVDTASTAREILEKVNEHCGRLGTCYDAVVADVNYFDANPGNGPRYTGISAASEIKKEYPDLPIVFMSAFRSQMTKDEALKYGDDFFDKPFDEKTTRSVDMLLNRVETLISFTTQALGGPGKRRAAPQPLKIPTIIEEAMAEVRASKANSNN